jgi:hypothetical protein
MLVVSFVTNALTPIKAEARERIDRLLSRMRGAGFDATSTSGWIGLVIAVVPLLRVCCQNRTIFLSLWG